MNEGGADTPPGPHAVWGRPWTEVYRTATVTAKAPSPATAVPKAHTRCGGGVGNRAGAGPQ